MLRGVPSVLLVDDDPTILRLLEVNFRLEGFDVATASCGQEALEMALDGTDAIVLDVTLPDMDGHDVYRALEQRAGSRTVPVVFLSARVPEDELDRYADAPVRFVSKPFDTEALVRIVRAAIARCEP